MLQTQPKLSSDKISDADVAEYFREGNAILNRMKNAIFKKKGIRLSAEEMQIISRMSIGVIIMDEDANPNHKSDF